jgi:anti-sigma factor RsiW
MTCRETKNLLNAYVDGELDSAGSLSVESHVERCASCMTDMENLRALASAIESGGLRFKAPQHLKRNVKAAIQVANPGTKSSLLRWRWASAFAAAVVVVIVGWAVIMQWTGSSQQTLLANDIVASHVRSMMANHITDVSSSDSHTVKPWFGGKLDYSPPVKDLTEQGFRLIGGRLDYVNNRPVAALVYQRNQHFINLFVWPSESTAIRQADQLTRQGYNLIQWTKAGMTYWLVSELNPTELNQCAQLLKEE